MAKDKIVEEIVEPVEQDSVVEEAPADPNGLTKMVHPDGRVAYAHESMIGAYKSGGFREE